MYLVTTLGEYKQVSLVPSFSETKENELAFFKKRLKTTMCCNSIIQLKKKKEKNKRKKKGKTDYLAFSLLTPEYFQGPENYKYYVLGTTGLDKNPSASILSLSPTQSSGLSPLKSTCSEPRLPCLEGPQEPSSGRERRSLGATGQWKHTL